MFKWIGMVVARVVAFHKCSNKRVYETKKVQPCMVIDFNGFGGFNAAAAETARGGAAAEAASAARERSGFSGARRDAAGATTAASARAGD